MLSSPAMESPGVSPEYIEELRESFALFDKDNDGYITSKELFTVMRALRIESTDDEIKDMIRNVDVDGSGTVDFNEFLKMMSRSTAFRRQDSEFNRRHEEDEMRQAFRIFDIDDNGYIDARELKMTMCNLGEDLSDKDVKKMMKLADKNGDGKIDYEEFIQMMYNK